MLKKVVSIGATDEVSLLHTYLKDVVIATVEFNNSLQRNISKELTNNQKQLKDFWYAGISLSFPILGTIADQFIGESAQPYYGKAIGSLVSLISFMTLKPRPLRSSSPADKVAYSSRERAYLYLNRLWEIRRSKLDAIEEN